MTDNTLTHNAIIRLTTEKDLTNIVVQVVDFKNEAKKMSATKQVLCSFVSDGRAKIKCFWDELVVERIRAISSEFNLQIVRLIKYTATPKNILIYDYEVVHSYYSEVIGKPVAIEEYKTLLATDSYQPNAISNAIQPTKTKKQIIKEIPKKEVQTPMKPTTSAPIVRVEQPTITKRLDIKNTNEFQEIKDLYPNLENWRIFCRIVKLAYKDFENKKGTRTKLLSMDLIDRKGTMINANIFGDYAEKMNQELKLNEVYIFSQGMVKIDTYNKSKPANDNTSVYTLTFTEYSKIVLTTDDKSVKNVQTSNIYLTLNDIKGKPANQQVDVVAIIKEIREQVEVPAKSKNIGNKLKKRTVIICDPINKTEMDAVFWNQLTNVDTNLLNKTVILAGFKIHQYNGALSLNSNYRSQVIPVDQHDYTKYEKDVKSINCSTISYRRDEGDLKVIRSIKKMEEAQSEMKENGSVWSDLVVYLNRIKEKVAKKWYVGCPFCKKTVAEGQTSCSSCGKSFDQPKTRYILQVELSDSTGSIWTTAYDDFSELIFNYVGKYPAEEVKNMSDIQFSELVKKCLFQEFKIKLLTKYEPNNDGTRRIKHTVAKLIPFDYAAETKNNLELIMKMK